MSCQVTALLSNRRLPARGWDDAQIEYLLTEISLMDSNNFSENVGVGEREGRVSEPQVLVDLLDLGRYRLKTNLKASHRRLTF